MTTPESKETKPWKPPGRVVVVIMGFVAALLGIAAAAFFLHWFRVACQNHGTYYYCQAAETSPPWTLATALVVAPVVFWWWIVRAWNRHVEVAVSKRAMELGAEKKDATAELLQVVKDWMALASGQKPTGITPAEYEHLLELASAGPVPQHGTAAVGFQVRIVIPEDDGLMKRSEEAVRRTERLSQQLQDLNTQFYSFNPNVYGRW